MADEDFQVAADEPEEGAPEWMVTFGDLMSLLLTFFVLLLSFSQMDAAKFKELSGSLEKAFGVQRKIPEYQPPKGMKMVARDFDQAFVEQAKIADGDVESMQLEEITEELRRLLATLTEQGLVELEPHDNYLVLRLLGQTTFESGQADIRPDMVPILRGIGEIAGRSGRDVFVAGHTDNIPIRSGRFRSNLELSAARAAAVVSFFLEEKLVTSDKVATMGYGEYRPVVPNDSAENRQKNRRVELILVSKQAAAAEQDAFPFSQPFFLSPNR